MLVFKKKRGRGVWWKKSKEEAVSVGEDENVVQIKRRLQFASRQDLVPMKGWKEGVWVYQLSRPRYTSSDALGHSNKAFICILPRSWQLAGWMASCWRQIRLWMRPAYLSTGYWDPPRNKLYQCVPETPQPARPTITPGQSTLGTHTYNTRLHVHNLQLFTQNKALLRGKSKELVTYLPSRCAFSNKVSKLQLYANSYEH